MKTIITILALFSLSLLISSQTVSTFSDGTPDDAIAIDSNDNIYVSNFSFDKVFKFTPTGIMTEFLTGISNPNGLDFDSANNLYLSQWSANLISIYLPNGTLDTNFNLSGNPSGIIKAFDNDDIIFSRYSGNSIHRMTPSGVVTDISNAVELNGPVGLTYDENGVLYVGNYNNRIIYRVLSNGNLEYVATVGNSSNLGFITYAQGKLWGTVIGEHKIYDINPLGIDDVHVFAGSTQGATDGTLDQAKFNGPNGIRFSNDETTMYVSEFNAKNLRVISNISLSVNNNIINDQIAVIANLNTDYLLLVGTLFSSNKIKVEIFNVLGQKVDELTKNTNHTNIRERINTSHLKSGVYLVKISTDTFITTKRVLIN